MNNAVFFLNTDYMDYNRNFAVPEKKETVL